MSSVWWVNQGITFRQALPGGYMWAPNEAANGRPMPHWETMHEVQPGDTVIHYANSHVRALSTVTAAAIPATSPDPQTEDLWDDDGQLVRVVPIPLDPMVPLQQLPGRVPDAGPFDRNGGVKQGYLYRVDSRYAPELLKAIAAHSGTSLSDGEDLGEVADAVRIIEELAPGDRVIPAEQMHAAGTSYTRHERRVVVDRAEAVLVKAYRDSLDSEVEISGLMMYSSGRPDLVVRVGDQVEMIEAKSAATHAKVREALGQILDYCHNTTTAFDRVAALFPGPPTPADAQLLTRYGIDVIYRAPNGDFTRVSAQPAAQTIWRAPGTTSPPATVPHPPLPHPPVPTPTPRASAAGPSW